MSAAVKTNVTPEQYLALDRAASVRSEYFAGEMFAMAGASYAHNTIKDNLIGELYARLKGGPCRTYSSDMRVKIEATKAFVYPDILIQCEPPRFADERTDILLNPQVVIEILSPSTESFDRGGKFRQYQTIPSLQEYLLVSQNDAVCERFTRGEGGKWEYQAFTGVIADLEFAAVPVRVPLRDIYAGVNFPEDTPP
jgi:Uma2 family endonuclease